MSCARSCLPKPAGIRCLYLQSTSSAVTRFESSTGYIVYPTSHQNSVYGIHTILLKKVRECACRRFTFFA